MTDPLQTLSAAGVSVWLDDLSRERLRDASQSRMLRVAELLELAASAGWTRARAEMRDLVRPVEPWLEHAAVSPEAVAEIETELRSELADGPASGLRPQERDGALWFTQRVAAVVG